MSIWWFKVTPEKTVWRTSGTESPYYLLAFSAKTPEALQEKIKEMIVELQKGAIAAKDLPRMSYTLLEGRQHFNYRCAVVVQDLENAVYVLKQFGSKERIAELVSRESPPRFLWAKRRSSGTRRICCSRVKCCGRTRSSIRRCFSLWRIFIARVMSRIGSYYSVISNCNECIYRHIRLPGNSIGCKGNRRRGKRER